MSPPRVPLESPSSAPRAPLCAPRSPSGAREFPRAPPSKLLEYPLCTPVSTPVSTPRNSSSTPCVPLVYPFTNARANEPSAARCAAGAVHAAPTRRSIAAWGTRWVLTAYSPPPWGTLAAVVANARTRRRVVGPKESCACKWGRVQDGTGLSGNGCKWEPKPARAAESLGRKCRCSHARTPARPCAHAQSGPHAVALGPSGRAVIGKSTFVGELAAGLGGAFVCLLVVSIVVFFRRRRSARAADPASDVRTLLYVDD